MGINWFACFGDYRACGVFVDLGVEGVSEEGRLLPPFFICVD